MVVGECSLSLVVVVVASREVRIRCQEKRCQDDEQSLGWRKSTILPTGQETFWLLGVKGKDSRDLDVALGEFVFCVLGLW